MFHIDFVLHPFDFSGVEIKTPLFREIRRIAQRRTARVSRNVASRRNKRYVSSGVAETHAVRLYIFARVPPSDSLVFHTDEVIFIKLPVRIAT
jgi:hypothetical protein